MEAKVEYTQDGSVDFRGQPAISSKTGKCKACAFLVGEHILPFLFTNTVVSSYLLLKLRYSATVEYGYISLVSLLKL